MTKHHLALSFLLLAPLSLIRAQQTNPTPAAPTPTTATPAEPSPSASNPATAPLVISNVADTNAVTIDVDCAQTIRTFAANPTGFCVSFLNDADSTNRPSLTPLIKSMKIGSLRFPEGALAEDYLFHDLTKGAPVEGHLQPRAIVPYKMPGHGRWLQPDGSFTPDTMDFDKYIALCRGSGAEPIITVAAKGHKFKDANCDEETILRNAEEWVRYANVTRKLGVKYWEIGNEVDHKEATNVISKDEYLDLYRKMVTRMKAVDPGIHTGLGTGHGPEYTRAALQLCPELVDFTVVHKYATEINTYEQYLTSRTRFFNGAYGTLKAIDEAAPEARRSSTELLVTEFSSFSFMKPLPPERKENSIMSAMITFEMLAQGSSLNDRVRFLDFWVTHNPWSADDNKDFANAFGPNNEILPQGRGVEIMSRFVLDRMVKVSCPEGPVRCWASASKDGSAATVWLVNRELRPKMVELRVGGGSGTGPWSTWVLSGTNPYDTAPAWAAGNPVTPQNGSIAITLAPLSITAVYKKASAQP